MSDFDLVIRGAHVVTPAQVVKADVGVLDEAISAIGPGLSGSARQEVDGDGCHLFPGVIDAHVHFNEPGRADWEGIDTGSRALAAGGGTLFFDMPLNAHPPTVDAESFGQKLAAAKQKSVVDFAFWGGLVPTNLDSLEELAELGVVGFKAFMCHSGIEDFEFADYRTLREGMKRAARVGLPVAVHAESEAMTRQLASERILTGRTTVRDYLDSRPIEAELEAIRIALDIAGETCCALHVVHVSCGEGVALIKEGKQKGVNVSCETCPHYLALRDTDMVKLGAVAKCAPPLRSGSDQEKLWEHLLAGDVTTVGSDHSPSPFSMKQDTNFFKVWGGISSVQLTLPLLLTEAHIRRSAPLPQMAALLSARVAERFKLPPTKGRIATGCGADFALVDLEREFEVKTDDLLYRHRHTPYVGRKLHGRIVQTFCRGRTVFKNGSPGSGQFGRLVKPVR